jgi:hypothetical protein
MSNVKNAGNPYYDQLGRLSDRIPKAVFAAIAVSFATCGGDHLNMAQQNVCLEWVILYENGIVPQRPPQYAFDLAAEVDPLTRIRTANSEIGVGRRTA